MAGNVLKRQNDPIGGNNNNENGYGYNGYNGNVDWWWTPVCMIHHSYISNTNSINLTDRHGRPLLHRRLPIRSPPTLLRGRVLPRSKPYPQRPTTPRIPPLDGEEILLRSTASSLLLATATRLWPELRHGGLSSSASCV